MRIIGGLYKRRLAEIPKWLPVRPTTERTREALAAILESRLDLNQTHALDMFSGTGMVTLDLVSCGVAQVTAVDKHPACINCLKYNLNMLGIKMMPELIVSEALAFLSQTSQQYSFIYADPPYNWNGTITMLELIFSKKILAANGLLILEHATQAGFSFRREFRSIRKYGTTALSIFIPLDY